MKKRDGELTYRCNSDRGGDFAVVAGFDGNIRGDISRATVNWADALSD